MKVVQLEHFTLEIRTCIGMYFKYMYFYILLRIGHRGSLCDRLIIESQLILFTVVLRIEIKSFR